MTWWSCTSSTTDPGFPPDFVARAFDRFSRADQARQRGGTGLGLYVDMIAKGTVQAGAANRPGGGADVWLAVPRATRRPAVEPVRAPAPVSRV